MDTLSKQPDGVIDNPEVGGTGVKRLRTWTGSKNGPTVIRGIQVVWSDGSESQKFGEGVEGRQEFTLGPNSVVTMTLNSGDRIDNIRITTKTDVFVAGGNGGKPTEQNVGNGTLLGFTGRAAWDIDSLGSVFRA
ncbi:hypothetical protein CRV24_004442 [Beauveria bassiana]|nr:hypothetical protein CRV24_004442 [Beauveria bassiana]